MRSFLGNYKYKGHCKTVPLQRLLGFLTQILHLFSLDITVVNFTSLLPIMLVGLFINGKVSGHMVFKTLVHLN